MDPPTVPHKNYFSFNSISHSVTLLSIPFLTRPIIGFSLNTISHPIIDLSIPSLTQLLTSLSTPSQRWALSQKKTTTTTTSM